MIEVMLTPPAAIEAILFASGEPLEKKQLTKLLDLTDKQLRIALDMLTRELAGHGIALVETTQDVELRTAPKAALLVKKLRESELVRDLGKASMETLAVIAYQDGATRGEVDWVRGVNSSTSLRTLLLRGLCEGREDERDKRRIRYSLTTEALAYLGVRSLQDLPRYAELSGGARVTLVDEASSAAAEDVTE